MLAVLVKDDEDGGVVSAQSQEIDPRALEIRTHPISVRARTPTVQVTYTLGNGPLLLVVRCLQLAYHGDAGNNLLSVTRCHKPLLDRCWIAATLSTRSFQRCLRAGYPTTQLPQ